jgi:hypothetical protein
VETFAAISTSALQTGHSPIVSPNYAGFRGPILCVRQGIAQASFSGGSNAGGIYEECTETTAQRITVKKPGKPKGWGSLICPHGSP